MNTFTADGSYIGTLLVEFTSPFQYSITYCTGWTSLPVPEEVDKIWTIRKTATALSIECNGVELLSYQFSDSSYDSCVSKWGGDVVDKIWFGYTDNASDSFRARPTGRGKL